MDDVSKHTFQNQKQTKTRLCKSAYFLESRTDNDWVMCVSILCEIKKNRSCLGDVSQHTFQNKKNRQRLGDVSQHTF